MLDRNETFDLNNCTKCDEHFDHCLECGRDIDDLFGGNYDVCTNCSDKLVFRYDLF